MNKAMTEAKLERLREGLNVGRRITVAGQRSVDEMMLLICDADPPSNEDSFEARNKIP